MGVRSGEAEVPEIIIVSDAVEGTFVDLDRRRRRFASAADRGENPGGGRDHPSGAHLGRLDGAASRKGES